MKIAAFYDSVKDALSVRFPAEHLTLEHMSQKEVPVHRMSWGYFTGGAVLLCLMIQAVTGVLLLFHYQPSIADAHASVEYITREVPGGAFVRNLHAWGASGMILLVQFHLLVSFAMKAFTKPREATWLFGVGLLMVTFAFGVSGYLLPWNQIAVNATKVIFQSIELTGAYLPSSLAHLPTVIKEMIQGEASVGQVTLSRFYALHVVILPLTVAGLVGFHLLMVQLHGMSAGVDAPPKRHESFFKEFLAKDLFLWVILLGLFVVLALVLPFDSLLDYPLTEPFEALGATPPGIKPEWYIYFVYYPMELLPFWVIIVAMTLLQLVLFFTPWIFKNTARKTLRLLAVLAGLYLVFMTFFGEALHHLIKGGS